MKNCNNCTALGKECIVEPDERTHTAQNCDQYEPAYCRPQRKPKESELSYQIRLVEYYERRGI